MAGAGFKDFTAGDILTATQVDEYLMQQSVMRFADAAARTTALSGVLAEGMLSYLNDTNKVQVYNGSSWVDVGGSSPLTTKGDLYTYSTADARLGVGANGTVLSSDSTESTGLKWVSIDSKIVNIVVGDTTTSASSSSSTWSDTNLTATITPTSASNKILVLVSQNGCFKSNGSADNQLGLRLVRGATTISTLAVESLWTNTAIYLSDLSLSGFYLDTPATTAATTYKTQFRSANSTASVSVQNGGVPRSTIILMEVAI